MSGHDLQTHKTIVFLHIPKTAGQSVHAFLERLVSAPAVAPARVNTALVGLSIEDLRRYKVISGHLDWGLLDCVLDPKFVFTVLRHPLDRILSFYFFLRAEAKRLAPEELKSPQRAGMRAALELSCDDYFCAGTPQLRNFLDNHYDNFYTFYFAQRSYDGFQRVASQRAHNRNLTDERLTEMALQNLALLRHVYRVDELGRLEAEVTSFMADEAHVPQKAKAPPPKLADLHMNVGDPRSSDERAEELHRLGATKRTFDRLKAMTRLDDVIWQAFAR